MNQNHFACKGKQGSSVGSVLEQFITFFDDYKAAKDPACPIIFIM